MLSERGMNCSTHEQGTHSDSLIAIRHDPTGHSRDRHHPDRRIRLFCGVEELIRDQWGHDEESIHASPVSRGGRREILKHSIRSYSVLKAQLLPELAAHLVSTLPTLEGHNLAWHFRGR